MCIRNGFKVLKWKESDLGLVLKKSENWKEILEKFLKVWVWFQLDCVGNEFRLMIQVLKKI